MNGKEASKERGFQVQTTSKCYGHTGKLSEFQIDVEILQGL